MDKRITKCDGLIGLTLDQYKIQELIKETGKNWVFRALDLNLNRVVALKILKLDQNLERQLQFSREGQRLANLGKHKYITTVYSAGQDKNYHYIAMELVDGQDLEDIINNGRALSLEEILKVMDCVTESIEYVHSKGIEHHDIKLENIKERKNEEGISYVLDFGDRLTRNEVSDDVFALGKVFDGLLSNYRRYNNEVPKKLEQIIKKSSYKTPQDFKNAIENYKKSISRRKFLKIAASIGILTGLGYSGFNYLDYRNSLEHIVDEISRVEATDYANINPLFNELLLKIIDHKIDWLVEDGKILKGKFPYATIENGSWFLTDGGYWSDGFWPGILWTAYEVTKKEKYKQWADEWTRAIKFTDKESDDIRSIRFYYSHARAYELTRDEFFRNNALKAAEFMASRFNEVGGFIEVGNSDDDKPELETIKIDSIRLLPLLWFAYENEVNQKNKELYYHIILSHLFSLERYNVRENFSIRDHAIFDVKKDEFIKEVNQFSYKPDSCYSRGQARAIKGFTFAYNETKNKNFLLTAEKLADYFINNLPKDFVPFYDFNDPNKNIPKDSSAAAIASSALLELFKFTQKEKYKITAYNILKSLSSRDYLSTNLKNYHGIIMHGCDNKNNGYYTNSSLIYGDYYFLENLKKVK